MSGSANLSSDRDRSNSTAAELTVIIPTYQRQELTIRAIASVREQSPKIEIIIVDDASLPAFILTDDLAELDNVSVLRHDKNRGAAAARNTGVRASRTSYITFLDSDDYLLPGTLAQRLRHAQTFQGLTITGCGWLDIREKGAPSNTRIPYSSEAPDDFYGGCWFCPGSAVIFRRSIFTETIGYFDETYRRLEDVEWCIRFADAGGQFKSCDVIGAAVQYHRDKNQLEIKSAADRLREETRLNFSLGKVTRKQFKRLKAYLHLELAVCDLRNGNKFRAMLRLVRSVANYPRTNLQLVPGWEVIKPDPELKKTRDQDSS